MGVGGRKGPNLANLLKTIEINGNRQFFESFYELWENSLFKKTILIKIKIRLMRYWKSLILPKEIKKHIGKVLPVWAKNHLRFNFIEKSLKFTYENLNWK